MAYTEDQLREHIAALETALLRNEVEVTFADRTVRYRSTSDIQKALTYFQGLLRDALGTSGAPKQFRAYAGKGL